MEKIELRDYFAAQLMSGKVDDFYRQAHREKIVDEDGNEHWEQVSASEATKKAIEPNNKKKTLTNTSKNAAKMLVIGPDTKTHIVQEGETLYRLSKKYNTTVSKLKEINNLGDNTIIANQKLVVRAR